MLAAWAASIRVSNAFLYPIHFGFDAPANWEYIQILMSSWTMPDPGEGWSTSHPPLFYYLAAAVGRSMPGASVLDVTIANRLLSSAIGLAGVAAAALLVWRSDSGNYRRVFAAAALLLFLPVHVYMSAMLGEEILAASIGAIVVVGVAREIMRPALFVPSLLRLAGLGVLAGLGFLTKLTGLIVIMAVVGTIGLDGLRRRQLTSALLRCAVFALLAIAVGGWPYLRNKIEYGYFYPQNLQVHEIMFTMPPGERELLDYLRFPLATFRDPQVLDPDLLRSVWGTTYTTIFFDGHRVFLPRSDFSVRLMGTGLLILALIPTAAFGIGLARGVRRAVESPEGPDTLLVALVFATLAGYVLFTWKNPWYATLKGSYLLGISVPFAYYASEVISDWTRDRGWRAGLIWAPLAVLLLASAMTFTTGLVWEKREGPGFVWPKVDPSRHMENVNPNAGHARPDRVRLAPRE